MYKAFRGKIDQRKIKERIRRGIRNADEYGPIEWAEMQLDEFYAEKCKAQKTAEYLKRSFDHVSVNQELTIIAYKKLNIKRKQYLNIKE